MDLDDVLEDLLKGARRALRDRSRAAVRHGIDAPVVRRWAPTAALVAGTWWVLALALAAVAVLVVVEGGAGVAAAIALGVLASFGVPVAGWGAVERRRRTRTREEERRERARALAADARLDGLPREVRDDWRRMEQAHALVADLAEDGWISADAVAELDGHLTHLEKVLHADHRTRELGGRSSPRLAGQVADLADLLVALADEAVEHQAEVTAGARVPVTLAQARDRMAALRAARREVDDLDGHAGGQRGTTSTA